MEKTVKGKIYRALSRISMPITLASGKQSRIDFGDEGNTYSTHNESTQKQIEESKLFKNKQIMLVKAYEIEIEVEEEVAKVDEKQLEGAGSNGGEDNTNPPAPTNPNEIKKIEGIKTVQEASEYLKTEYGIDKRRTSTYNSVLAVAQEQLVEFPDLEKPTE